MCSKNACKRKNGLRQHVLAMWICNFMQAYDWCIHLTNAYSFNSRKPLWCCVQTCMFRHVHGRAVNRQGKAHSMEAKHEAVQADESRTSSINWLMPHGAGADQVDKKDPQQLLSPVAHAHCSSEHS